MLGWVLVFITMLTIVLQQSLKIGTQLAPYLFTNEKNLKDMAQDTEKRKKLIDTLKETIKKIKDALSNLSKKDKREE